MWIYLSRTEYLIPEVNIYSQGSVCGRAFGLILLLSLSPKLSFSNSIYRLSLFIYLFLPLWELNYRKITDLPPAIMNIRSSHPNCMYALLTQLLCFYSLSLSVCLSVCLCLCLSFSLFLYLAISLSSFKYLSSVAIVWTVRSNVAPINLELILKV